MKVLFVFDFDDTIITENSDFHILEVLPNGTKLPQEIQNLYSRKNWMEYMGAIFAYLKKVGVDKKQILACMESIPVMPGFKELMKFLVKNGVDIIIISDGNSVFIDHILQHNQMRSLVKKVFTNHAEFDKEGLLKVSGYHKQDHCKMSTENLCKGQVMEDFLKKQKEAGASYDMVGYVGDGGNDYCPSLRLTAKDVVFPRINYQLDSKIQENASKIKAKVVRWEDGFDIINHLKCLLPH